MKQCEVVRQISTTFTGHVHISTWNMPHENFNKNNQEWELKEWLNTNWTIVQCHRDITQWLVKASFYFLVAIFVFWSQKCLHLDE